MFRSSAFLTIPVAVSAWSMRLGRRGPHQAPGREAALVEEGFLPEAPALDESSVADLAATSVGDTAKFAYPEGPILQAAVNAARVDTYPPIVPNVTDPVWYKDDYAQSPQNALEKLSWTTHATDPTPQEVAWEANRTKEWLAVLMPPLEALDKETNNYYKENYPWDNDNDLDNFTRHRKFTTPLNDGSYGPIPNRFFTPQPELASHASKPASHANMDETASNVIMEKAASSATTEKAASNATAEASSNATAAATSNATAEATSNATVEVASNTTSEANMEAVSEATAEAASDATVEATMKAASDAAAQAVSDATSEAASDATAEATSGATSEAASNATAESVSDATGEAGSNATAEVVSNLTADALGNATAKSP